MKRSVQSLVKIVVAPNAFKESLSAHEAARAIERGLRRVLGARAEIVLVPVADGGDGTLETLVRATGGRIHRARVDDPLGRPVSAPYGVTGERDARCAIEMARASGLALLAPRERNPVRTSTRGTGQLIARAARRGLGRFIVGVGGSATVDGGMGLAHALGYRFLDRRGRELAPCGGNLERIVSIDPARYEAWRRSLDAPLEIVVASDVTNPLLGPRGAARVFAPQKGATPRGVERLENGLVNLARAVRRDLGVRMDRLEGGGAAGGLAAGLVAFCGAEIRSGAQVVCQAVNLETRLAGADWVVTGEGCIDAQTACGKAPVEVARLARRSGARVVGVAGALGEGNGRLLRSGDFDALFSICGEGISTDESIRHARRLLAALASEVGGLIECMSR
ncbi:glycerate kinase [Candidatus Sumerlaeota bacterium]|nr:glycerate kinase [Candidatus Sumerlaeota bacterium]